MPSTKTKRQDYVKKEWEKSGIGKGRQPRKIYEKGVRGGAIITSDSFPEKAVPNKRTTGMDKYSGAASRTRMRNGEWGAVQAVERLKSDAKARRGTGSGPRTRPNNGKRKKK